MAEGESDKALSQYQELETALAGAHVGVWVWDVAPDRLRWSHETARMYGLPAETSEGRFEHFRDRVHPDDRPHTMQQIERALAGEASDFEGQHRVLHDGAQARWLHGRGRVVCDDAGRVIRLVGAVMDISALKQQSEQVRESEELYRLFAELASDYVYVVDIGPGAFAPSFVAGGFERTTGYSPAEIAEIGGWTQVMHPDDRGTIAELMQVLRAGRTVVNEYRIVTKQGDVRWLRDRVRPTLDPQTGELARLVGGVQDITERKELEAQLVHAQKLEALARLSGSVAHDFNNLLTVMMGACDLLAEERKDEDDAIALRELKRSLTRASELTSSLLSFARRKPAVRRVAPLGDALGKALALLKRAMGERIRMEVDEQAGEVRVSVDQAQFEMALLSLALNARDAMRKGGTLGIATRVQTFAADSARRPSELAPGSYATIEVRDTGTGIAPELLPRIFEPFGTKGSKGPGLGLSAVHGIVSQFEGAITASSTLGRGSTFTIFLPIAQGPAGKTDPRRERHSIGGNERVVLVEDDHAVRGLVQRALEDLGYRVTAFEHAEAALQEADAVATCDLLLTDVRLPGMAGTELAEICVERRPALRVILTSGYVADEAQAAIVASGRHAFLPKPFVRDGLARRVREVLDVARKGPSQESV